MLVLIYGWKKRGGEVIHKLAYILQKQIGCFNHKVVTLVADKQKRQWLCTIYFADYIRQLESKLPRLSYNQHLAVSNH